MPRCSDELLEGCDKCTGAISYLSSLALLALGCYGFYQSYRAWSFSDNDHDLSLFLAVTGLFLVGGAILCFLAEMRIPAIRNTVLSGCSFTWSRQGRGWFFLYLGLFALFLPYDRGNPWVTKTVGSLQLLAGVMLCCLAYIGGMREDLYGSSLYLPSSSSSGSSSSSPGFSSGSSRAARDLEEWGGNSLSKRHQPAGDSTGTGVTPLRPGVVAVNPFLAAAAAQEKAAEAAAEP
jgi:peptidoglycan/LPS O-acetylase OafA/YrhL